MVEIVSKVEAYNKLLNGLDFLRDNSVYVGIADDTTERENIEGKEITNAELLFIHTNGSPVNHIPARPVIEPAIKKDRERLLSMMKKAASLAIDGNKSEALNQLRKVGMRGQNISRAWFVNPENGWPPNSPAVQAEKRRKGSTDPKPLIDTGELRKSITYFVKTKEGRQK